jgi:hypothetical protein
MAPKSAHPTSHTERSNDCWQCDVTLYPLAGGARTDILVWVDAHAHYVPSVTAHDQVTGATVAAEFRVPCAQHGVPGSAMTDNSMFSEDAHPAARTVTEPCCA